MFEFLKRKKKVETKENDELIEILLKYIEEAKRLKWEDDEIKQKFKEKRYSNELINLVFRIYEMKGGKDKMVKKHKEEDEDEEEEEEEELDTEDEDERPIKKKIKEAPKTEEQTPQELTEEQKGLILANHEGRISQLEGTLFRLKNI